MHLQGEVLVASDPEFEHGVDGCLTGGSQHQPPLQLVLTRMGNPENLAAKALDVLLLLAEGVLRYDDWELHRLVSVGLQEAFQFSYYPLDYAHPPPHVDAEPLHRISVVYNLSAEQHVIVPIGEAGFGDELFSRLVVFPSHLAPQGVCCSVLKR